MIVGLIKIAPLEIAKKQTLKSVFGGFLLLIWLLFSFGQVQAQISQKYIGKQNTIEFSLALGQNHQTNILAANKQVPTSYLAEVIDEEFREEGKDTKEDLKDFLALFYRSSLARFISLEQTRFTKICAALHQIVTPPLFVLHKNFKHFLI